MSAGAWVQQALLWLALAYVTKEFLRIVATIYAFFLRAPKDLKKYGKWAVVTGGTDGIGQAMAQELARRGLSVFLISRSAEKLEATAAAIKESAKNVEVATLAVDFSKFDASARARVQEALKSKDVGVLVNNVGQSYRYATYWHELEDEQVSGLLDVNIPSVTYMTRIVLPGMLDRKRGAVVSISSIAGKMPCPGLAQYSGAKSFMNLFSRSLAYEVRGKGVDVQVQNVAFVTTKISKLRHESLFVISPKKYAVAACNAIGYEAEISPYWSHALQLWVLRNLPESIMNRINMSQHMAIRKKGLKKDAEQKESAKAK